MQGRLPGVQPADSNGTGRSRAADENPRVDRFVMRREGKEGGFCGQFGQIMLTQHYVCKTYFSFLFVWRSQTIRPPSLPPRHGVQSLE